MRLFYLGNSYHVQCDSDSWKEFSNKITGNARYAHMITHPLVVRILGGIGITLRAVYAIKTRFRDETTSGLDNTFEKLHLKQDELGRVIGDISTLKMKY